MPELKHFYAWSNDIVPHLSASEKQRWAENLHHLGHPGFTTEATIKAPEPPIPAVTVVYHIGRLTWAWRILVLLCLIFLCVTRGHSQMRRTDEVVGPVVIRFAQTNPSGAGCTFGSPIQYFQGTQYTCSNNTTYAASGGGSSSWSSLTNPTANLSLAMGGFNSLFTLAAGNFAFEQDGIANTSTDAVILQNTTAATAGVLDQFSPRLRLVGHYWSGSADVLGEWVLEQEAGNAGTFNSLMMRPKSGATLFGVGSQLCFNTSSQLLKVNLDGNLNANSCVFAGAGGIGGGGGWGVFQNIAGSSTETINFTPNGENIGSAKILTWDSTTSPGNDQTCDTGLCRSSASVLGINDGSATCTLSHFKTAIYQHTLSSGTAPTLTVGTGTIIGGDQGFRITLTAGSQTTLTVTFNSAYTTNVPIFTCVDETTAANNPVQAVPTLSTVVINATGTFGAADKIACHGTGIIGI